MENGHDIAAVLTTDGTLAPWWDTYMSKKTPTSEILKVLWKMTGDAVTLSIKEGAGKHNLLASKIQDFDQNEYIGENSPDAFILKLRRYQEANINRAYMLVGPPGCGKTTFCFKLAKKLGGKILVITPALLEDESLQHQDLVDMVKTFKPNVLLFEDIDRVSKDRLLLSLIDFIRQESPLTLLLATANEPESIVPALKRPGRLGPPILFKAPDPNWRKSVLKLYCEKIGVSRDLGHLAEFMDHPHFTHDYLKDVCEQALVEDDAYLQKYIEGTIAGMPEMDLEEDEEIEEDEEEVTKPKKRKSKSKARKPKKATTKKVDALLKEFGISLEEFKLTK